MAKSKPPKMIQVAVRLPAALVKLLDEAAAKDAAAGFAPSRSRTLVRVLPAALEPLVAAKNADDGRASA